MKALSSILTLLFITAVVGAEPNPPKHSVVKPTFMTGYDSFSGGTAFLCKVEQLDLNLVLTAHHLFGPACGWEKEFKWDQLDSTFEAMTGLSMGGDNKRYITSTELIAIPRAQGLNNEGYDRDICAWRIPEANTLPTLTLAQSLPSKDAVVYLFARKRGSEVLQLFKATVIKSSFTEFEYMYDENHILNGTSGAPVLNEKGEVIAINIGGYENENSQTIGFGNPLPSIIKMLKSAQKKQIQSEAEGDAGARNTP